MAQKQPSVRLSRISISLHWLVAFSMIGMLILGLYMKNMEAWGLYDIHKSLGVLLAIPFTCRVIWRLWQGWPAPAADYTAMEQRVSKVVHWLLLVCIFLMPLSGLCLSGASGHGFGIFGWLLFPFNHDAEGHVIPFNDTFYQLATSVHHYLGYGLVGLVIMHVLGAFKHHLVDKDNTLRRMLGRQPMSD